MKKKILLAVMVLISLTSFAQSNIKEQQSNNSKENGKYIYCAVSTIANLSNVIYDDGTERDKILKDENGKRMHFNTDISIINYMTLQGWELYIYNDHGKTVFRKKVSDEEAQELLKKMRR